MKIFMVINPISGAQDKAEILKKVKQKVSSKNLIIYKTSGDNDHELIRAEIKKQDFDRILVAGGDGTIKTVSEAIGQKSISIGILPLGSSNGLAHDLNLPIEADDFIEIALGSHTKKIDVISINNQLGLHISDLGLNAELVKEYENSRFRGKFGYAINSIPALFQSKGPYEFTITTDKETFKRKAIMLAFANSKKFGTGAVINPEGKINDGLFEIIIIKKFDIIEIFKTLNNEVELSPDFAEVISTTKATVTTEQPVDFQIDGEYFDDVTEVEAYILPKKIEIAIGE